MFCYVLRELFLPVIPDDTVQFRFCILIDDIPRRQSLPQIHPHVQRRIVPVGKPPLGVIQLKRGYPQIQHDAVHLLDASLPQHLHGIAIIIPDQRHSVPIRRKPSARRLYGRLILIDPDQPAALMQCGSDPAGMASAAQCTVHIDTVRFYLQVLYCLLQKN